MPQIGWLEILTVVIIAILVLGPKEFPIALKKIGSFFGKLKKPYQGQVFEFFSPKIIKISGQGQVSQIFQVSGNYPPSLASP